MPKLVIQVHLTKAIFSTQQNTLAFSDENIADYWTFLVEILHDRVDYHGFPS